MENQAENQKPVVQQEPLKTLFSWESPSRTFKKRDKEFFRTIASLLILVVLILFFAQQFMLILAVLATAFLAYVLNTVPPDNVSHSITTHGITMGQFRFGSAGYTYTWKEMKHFFFSEKYDQIILDIDVVNKIPGRLMLLINREDKETIKQILSKYLMFKENVTLGWLDKASSWLSEKIPLEKTSP